jgi:hypothetical protein
MQFFINKYIQEGSGSFYKLLTQTDNAEDLLVFGPAGDRAAVSRINGDGDIVWSKTYEIPNEKIALYHPLRTPNGDYLALGRFFVSTPRRAEHFLLRMTSDGSPLWARRLTTGNTRNNIALTRIGEDEYAITAWYNIGGSQDKIEVIKVDGSGQLITSRELQLISDTQVLGAFSSGPNLYLFGGASMGAWDSFLVRLNAELTQNIVYRFLTNGNTTDDIQAAHVVQPSSPAKETFLLAGKTGQHPYYRSFLMRVQIFKNRISLLNAVTFDVTQGYDHIRQVLVAGGLVYVLGQHRDSHYAYVACFDSLDLSLQWVKKFELESNYGLVDMQRKFDDQLWFSGYCVEETNQTQPLLIKTDLELTTCKTVDIPGIEVEEYPVELEISIRDMPELEVSNQLTDLAFFDTVPEKLPLCSEKVFEPKNNRWLQSPYLYLQSAGSLGQDASQGILLRWLFLRNLGQDHLPKGDYSQNTNGFNKPDDYVCVYRAAYESGSYEQELDLTSIAPLYIDHTQYRWVYQTNRFFAYLHFLDQAQYDQARVAHDPHNDPQACLVAYGNGVLELELRNELAFSVKADLLDNSLGELQLETHSVQGDLPLEETGISARKIFSANSPGQWEVYSENIRKVRVRATQSTLKSFRFEFYADVLMTVTQQQGWTALGKFALSKDTTEVHLRLEDTSRFQVNGQWQKYNDDAYVNVQNYQDRWAKPNDGLQAGVDKYIQLSETDPQAIDTIIEQEDGGSNTDVSYLDLLQIASLDYQVARMLGLGHIDTPGPNEFQKFIYLAEYTTEGQLDTQAVPTTRQHLYMSLPTALTDERLPQGIQTLPVQYGINLYNGTNQSLPLTDGAGYVPFDALRYINVYGQLVPDYSLYNGFFQPALEFALSDFSLPVFAGIEYRLQGEASWRKPEISHDLIYLDASPTQNNETLPIPFANNPDQPLFIHEEQEEGIHEYTVYGINLLSRASGLQNSVLTDYTEFIKPNTLLPPHNLRVQLIQEEGPLLLTSQNEQQLLAGQTGDKTLVRVSFRYMHLHDINYAFGNQVEIFFRDLLPRNIEGGILSIANDTDDKFAIVTTQAYNFDSTGQTVVPNIPTTFYDNFIGGVLVIGEARYIIEDIWPTQANGDYPQFKIRKHEDRSTVDLGGGNLVNTQSYPLPDASAGDLFLVIENMTKAASWGTTNPLAFTVDLGDASWITQSETVEDDDAGTIVRDLRGVWDTATITPKAGATGYYDVVFDSYQLAHHPQYKDYGVAANIGQDSVDWYQGVLRVRPSNDNTGTEEKITLDVVLIENIGDNQNLRLVVHDEAYQDHLDSGKDIQTGSGVTVNFYPGYKAYLHEDSPHQFDKDTILPQMGEGSKNSLIGLRTVDTTTLDSNSDPYHSPIGTPQILHALEIINPEPPKLPTGPTYATPPDFYSRSTYSFTTEFRAETFAAIFYRADVNAVLKALYQPETYQLLRDELPPPDADDFYSDRIQAIINSDYNTSNGYFTPYDLDGTPYIFPKPDNPDYGFDPNANAPGNTNPDPADMVELITAAVHTAFVPLTEQPLIYSFIRGGDYVPQPKKQTIRDQYGKLLDPTDPDYDLAPMAKRMDGTDEVLFTDFTLDGEMSVHTTYLYCVREMGNRMIISEPSPILGPIQLVNTNPPEAPIIRKLTTQLADALTGSATAVNFEINAYPASRNIKKVQIYRALRAVDALHPRTMTLAQEVEITTTNTVNGVISIQDDFSDLSFTPYGDPLFYRIVALREVIYEDIDNNTVITYVPSKPSKTLLSNVVDVFNPEPPQLAQIGGTLNNDEIQGLTLKWNKTAYNAIYYLFQMNSRGNWNKVTEIRSNDETDLHFTFTDPVPKTDEDGDTIYHRFKVTVENSSGLLNLTEEILTL